jgi:hypothetical protein
MNGRYEARHPCGCYGDSVIEVLDVREACIKQFTNVGVQNYSRNCESVGHWVGLQGTT